MEKKRIVCLILTLFIVYSFCPVYGINNDNNIYTITIEGEIGPAIYEYVKSSLKQISEDPNAAGLIFMINTYGGRVDSANKISKLILNTDLPTISFVNNKAVSAGVLLTISSDYIAMAPGATIGSAETIPNTEKILSEWVSSLRTVAQEKNRDPELVAAMADISIEIPNVIEKGRLLNLTSQEAKDLNFIDSIEKDYTGVLEAFNIEYDKIIDIPINNKVKLAQVLTGSFVAPALLTIGFIGFIIEIFVPGFGLAGTLSLMAYALYFAGAILAGHTGMAVLLVFLAGLVLLLIEASIPGFGFPGIGGILCIIISIVMASNNAFTAIISLFVSFVFVIITLIVIIKFVPGSSRFNRIILATQMRKEEGFTAFDRYNQYLGLEGIAITSLRPAGTIEVEGKMLDVVTEGRFVEAGSRVKVTGVEGRRIVVKNKD